MEIIVELGKKEVYYKTKKIDIRSLKFLSSDLSQKILNILSKNEMAGIDIARKLREHEQKIYYHLKNLEKSGFINLIKKEERAGSFAKIYRISSPTFYIKLKEEKLFFRKSFKGLNFLRKFFEDGKEDFLIVVGAPYPHGRFANIGYDSFTAIDISLIFGLFCSKSFECYRLDTEIKKEELEKNLILVGGPKSNIIVDKINYKLPIYFNEKSDFDLISTKTNSIYKQDEAGAIMLIKNPFNKEKNCLIIAGKRYVGTRAATLALIKYPYFFKEDYFANVTLGIDRDGDGKIDDAEILE